MYCFGRCEFDPGSRQLLIDGAQAVIGGRAFDLLVALVEHRDRVVSKDELYELVWPGLAVEPNNLQVQVWALRRLLGPAVIATVPRRGYQFMAPVQTMPGTTRHPPQLARAAAEGTSDNPALQAVSAGLHKHRLVTLICPDDACAQQVALAATLTLAPRTAAGAWQALAEVLTGERLHTLPCSAAEQAALAAASARLQAFLQRLAAHPALALTGRSASSTPLPAVLVVLGCSAAEGSTAAVRELLAMAPRLHVLATARHPLGLPEETVLQLPLAGLAVQAPRPRGHGLGPLRWQSRHSPGGPGDAR